MEEYPSGGAKMFKAGRNDPCPCGSGQKFKKCHLGREGELFLRKNEPLHHEAGQQIFSLPQVYYGRSKEMIEALSQEGLLDNSLSIKCIDLGDYRHLGFSGQDIPVQTLTNSAGIMVNVYKTREVDPNHLYLAITPKIQDSTLIHQIAHVLDYIKGSGQQPGTYKQMGLETGIPAEHLDHSQEFGYWLDFLKNHFKVELDAEDAIISFLYQNQMLLKSEEIKAHDPTALIFHSKQIMDFMIAHKSEINNLIQNRAGYIGEQR
ncbi:MAG: SEC-C domain-containing protein [Deltaproteobacteria bacterium]|nr:SEC-C domain-containing protein [Deltaproteobacteria bacterium]